MLDRVDPQPYYAHIRQRTATREFDCTSQLGNIRAQTLILHGRRDHVVPYELAVELRDGIPEAKLIPFRGGHVFFMFAERKRFVNSIAEFQGDPFADP